jgi:hypothetical protein
MKKLLVVVALHVGAGCLSSGCMDTRTASLGLENPRIPSLAPDAASAPAKRDAGTMVTDTGSVPGQVDPPNDDADRDDVDDHEGDDHDALPVDEVHGAPDAGGGSPSIDAGPVPSTAVDAGVSDTSVAHQNDERDGAREDAKAPVSPLCIAEPWHCQ